MIDGQSRTATPLGGDELFATIVILIGVVTMAVWSGAQLATLLSHGHFAEISIGDGFRASLRLPANAAEPRMAWPAKTRTDFAGPVVYWIATALAASIELCGAAWLWIKVTGSRVGTSRRQRLGVTVGARIAKPADLAGLVVPGPLPGRFIFGSLGNRLLATENGMASPSKRRFTRATQSGPGRRSAVVVIGPSQSGKTATVISGILDWEGPAILSSVKNDLFDATVERRLQLGDVFVFDPMRTIPILPDGVKRVGWSPLHSARTVPGAIEVSLALLDAAPTEGVTNASYWTSKGQALLWPMLFAAAQDPSVTMADVVRWLASQDGNTDQAKKPKVGATSVEDKAVSTIRSILEHTASTKSAEVAIQARHALAQFDGFFKLDHRTRSDIYSTSQTLVQPWEDPNISYASSPDAGPVADLKIVMSGRNTLYVATPLKDASRYAVVFGGLIGSLLRDQAYDVANRYRRPLPGLLCVIDEAGNTPLRWMPEVASTCSGVGVQLVTVWQSKAQVEAIYQNQTDPLLTNHATKIFFAGASDVETLRYVTYLGGEEEVQQRSANADAHLGGHRRGVGDSTIHRPLLPPEVLRQAAPGNAILFHGSVPPAHIQGRHAPDDMRLRALSEGNGPKPATAQADDDLIAALNFDPTPPLEVLKHLDTGLRER